MQKLIVRTVREGLTGIECLAGIPGTVGGGIRMNAGGKFGDIGACVTRVLVMDQEGTVFERTKDDLVFDYRNTNIAAKFILGATLELEDLESGASVKYQIVGDDEADIDHGLISISSPIARALIGKSEGDVASVQAPGGVREYEIIAVSYI